MIGLPKVGDRVRIWPMPGRRVQNGPRPVDHMGGGRWLKKSGEIVIWSEFHHDQYMHGDLLLHPPPCADHEHEPLHKEGEPERWGECRHCGRTKDQAAKYDEDYAKGAPPNVPHPGKRPTPKAAEEPKLFDPHAAAHASLTDEQHAALASHAEKDEEPAAEAAPAAAPVKMIPVPVAAPVPGDKKE